ncbi:MAG: thrombospondin type 3 repeat-containing protein, partial [Kiritimatiellales bacterium]|nr:thrombospondin type 3 repeat-containing protein [Kiritimatiellales bacterium]
GEYTAVVSAIPSNTLPWASAYFPGSQVPQALWFGTRLEIESGVPVLVPGQEYTLEFEAKGNDSWEVNGQVVEKVPRALMIHGVADYGYNNPASVFLNPEWTTYLFSMIADTNAPPPLCFGVSEQIGSSAIRNIRLYQGCPERWMREFKNGRVYLNMTLEPWTVNVGTGVVQRLVGSQIPGLNNGDVVNGMLTIPAWDAAFLRTWTFDAWQTVSFTADQLANSAISGESADPDGDGFTNQQEYIAGTDPLDAQSQFVIAGGGFNGAEDVLNWSSVSGRVYDVYWSTNLLYGFAPLATDIAWPQSSYTSSIPNGVENGFYQIKVRRP